MLILFSPIFVIGYLFIPYRLADALLVLVKSWSLDRITFHRSFLPIRRSNEDIVNSSYELKGSSVVTSTGGVKDCDNNSSNKIRGSRRTIIWNSRSSTSSEDDSSVFGENNAKTNNNKSFVEIDKNGNAVIRGISQMSEIVKDDHHNVMDDLHQHDNDAMIHFCFLVHGYHGKPNNLSYLQSVMVKTALKTPSSRRYSRGAAGDTDTNTNTDTDADTNLTKDCVANHPLNNDDLDCNSVATSMHRSPRLSDVDNKAEHEFTWMKQEQQQLVIHKCKCNLNRTGDGVKQGGERLYKELLDVIRCFVKDQSQRKISGGVGGGDNTRESTEEEKEGDDSKESISTPTTCVTISMVGNSLGGLYSRYALVKISGLAKEQCANENNDETNQQSDDNGSILIDGGEIRIYFNVFCTTATPHLGVSGHTWLPIPRKIETKLSRVMDDTGRDIFRLNELIKTMCTCPTYLELLALFEKRIAYANAYYTDFAVPTQTAAFLNENSTYPHHILDIAPSVEDITMNSSDGEADATKNDLIVATFNTPRLERKKKTSTTLKTSCIIEKSALRDKYDGDKSHTDELLEMSTGLDELGWQKVFVDIRSTLPYVPIPCIGKKRGTSRLSYALKLDSSQSEEMNYCLEEEENEELDELPSITSPTLSSKNQRNTLQSRDVAKVFSSPDNNVLSFPMGHNMMVADSKNKMSTFIYKGGRPLMDKLGKDLVNEILSWNQSPRT